MIISHNKSLSIINVKESPIIHQIPGKIFIKSKNRPNSSLPGHADGGAEEWKAVIKSTV